LSPLTDHRAKRFYGMGRRTIPTGTVFKSTVIEEVALLIRELGPWRDRQMARRTKTSTLNNITSTWYRVIATAVERGSRVRQLFSKGTDSNTLL
jgi:hypothetical protein